MTTWLQLEGEKKQKFRKEDLWHWNESKRHSLKHNFFNCIQNVEFKKIELLKLQMKQVSVCLQSLFKRLSKSLHFVPNYMFSHRSFRLVFFSLAFSSLFLRPQLWAPCYKCATKPTNHRQIPSNSMSSRCLLSVTRLHQFCLTRSLQLSTILTCFSLTRTQRDQRSTNINNNNTALCSSY